VLRLWTASILLLGLALTVLAWTPSSYGIVLSQLGAAESGLIWGEPQAIRSDEYAVWTPLIQASVHNDFRRHNDTSPYNEDLRNFNALPLWDWALPLKPSMWGFFTPMGPARAFAWSWALPLVAFLLGWERLFRRLGAGPIVAMAASGTLWTTGYVQTWWTTTGPLLAAWPWVLLAATAPWRPAIRLPIIAWTTATCLLAHLYPPLLISLAPVGAAVLFLTQADRQRLLIAAVGVALGTVLVLLYLGDVIPLMADTLYPGQRVSPGGSVPPRQLLDLVLPGLAAWRGESLLDGVNVCEAATLGTAAPLLILAALDRRACHRRWSQDPLWRRQITVLAVLSAIMLGWMVLPVPSWMGAVLGWHKVPPTRMVVAGGIVLVLLVLRLPTRVPKAGIWVLAWLWNLGHWADFNPVQSAEPLFARPETPILSTLQAQTDRDPRGWLVVPGFGGAVLNGQGFSAVSHVLIAPQVDWFSPYFPELSPGELRTLFQRFAHIQLYGGDEPELVRQDVVRVPLTVFGPALKPLGVHLDPDLSERFPEAGWIDQIIPGDPVVVTGWGLLDGTQDGRGLVIRSDWPIQRAHAQAMLRPDVAQASGDAGLGASGFRLELTLSGPAEGPLCIITEDPERGQNLVQQIGARELCADLRRQPKKHRRTFRSGG
jgi:hypothetical protein